MNNNTNNNNNPYGHLLDKYLDGAHFDYRTDKQKEEEAKAKYGHLLDYAKPDYKIYKDIIGVDDVCRRMRQQRADDYEQANIRRQERIENERREQQERIDRNNALQSTIN